MTIAKKKPEPKTELTEELQKLFVAEVGRKSKIPEFERNPKNIDLQFRHTETGQTMDEYDASKREEANADHATERVNSAPPEQFETRLKDGDIVNAGTLINLSGNATNYMMTGDLILFAKPSFYTLIKKDYRMYGGSYNVDKAVTPFDESLKSFLQNDEESDNTLNFGFSKYVKVPTEVTPSLPSPPLSHNEGRNEYMYAFLDSTWKQEVRKIMEQNYAMDILEATNLLIEKLEKTPFANRHYCPMFRVEYQARGVFTGEDLRD